MANLADKQLVNKYRHRDGKSLEILIKRYLNSVYRFVYTYVHNAQEAEDITQETFLKMWRNIKKYDSKKHFKTWLFTIAKNTALDFMKKKKTIPFSQFENNEGHNFLTESLADPSSLIEQKTESFDILRFVQKRIEKLMPKYRLVLSFYYGENLNFREIAGKLNEPLNTVKSRHRRALIQLKESLKNF